MPNNEPLALPTHGAATLPSVKVESYNLEIEDDEGFVGDKASKSAFWEIVEKWRQPLKDLGEDPFGDAPSGEIGKKQLETLLIKGGPQAAGLVQSAVEDFAQQLAKVIKRFLRVKAWRDVECIAIGGGFRGSRLGELAIGRCALLLKSEELPVSLQLIANDPHEAGLLGAAHLLPAWMFKGYEGMLAVDIGCTTVANMTVRPGCCPCRYAKRGSCLAMARGAGCRDSRFHEGGRLQPHPGADLRPWAACIDAVRTEPHKTASFDSIVDRAKVATFMERTERTLAHRPSIAGRNFGKRGPSASAAVRDDIPSQEGWLHQSGHDSLNRILDACSGRVQRAACKAPDASLPCGRNCDPQPRVVNNSRSSGTTGARPTLC